MTREQVMARCRTFVESEYLAAAPGVRLDDGDDLFEAGVLDSTGAVELVAYVEEAFGIRVDDLEITVENFGSLLRIGGYVARKIEERACVS